MDDGYHEIEGFYLELKPYVRFFFKEFPETSGHLKKITDIF
jgi:hypothetical protein